MMTAHNFYQIISSIIPLYIAMFIGYGSMKWWKLFNQEQCSGISRFCSLFAVPVLSFDYITKTNLFEMNLKLLGADVLQKVTVLLVLACWYKLGPRASIEQVITFFSICTLPNALILGVPIMRSMFHATPLVVEIFLAQSVIWHTLLLIMYEYRATRIVISQKFRDTHDRDVEYENTTTCRQCVVGGISSKGIRAEEVEAIDVVDVGDGANEDLEIHFHPKGQESSRNQPSVGNGQGKFEGVPSISNTEVIRVIEHQCVNNCPTSMSSTSVMIHHIMTMVWKKFYSNPNTYATSFGLIWAFISSKYHILRPTVVIRSSTFLSSASLGMGMFNMGLSMGLQPTLIPCDKVVAALSMVLRFIIGPIVMAFASLVIGLRGNVFHIATVQAAVSLGAAPSVFAVEYNVFPKIFSFGTMFGMVVALPATLLYYNLFQIQG